MIDYFWFPFHGMMNVTCEGRYSIIFLYHICSLMHLKKEKLVNMPYYFLSSLTKMAKAI
jgi:hypothetical protein